jgi:hypothetical protein
VRRCERRQHLPRTGHTSGAPLALRQPGEPGVLLGAFLVGFTAVLMVAVVVAQAWLALSR